MSNTRIRPATLSSTALQNAVGHRISHEFTHAIAAINQLSGLYDSLIVLHDTPDPSRTKEARALRYKQQHEAAIRKAKTLLEQVAGNMDTLARKARESAEQKAGLHEHMSDALAAELRGALRSLPEKDRNAAIMSAATHKEVGILKAVIESPSALLIGPVSVPLDQIITDYLDTADPSYRETRQDVESAQTHFEFALDTFITETKKLRDPALEEKAEIQQQAITRAETQLQEGEAAA